MKAINCFVGWNLLSFPKVSPKVRKTQYYHESDSEQFLTVAHPGYHMQNSLHD